MQAIFVSDIHITSMDDKKAKKFLAFLQQLIAGEISHLFLVGDIFDLWVGDHEYFKKSYEPLISEIRRLVKTGVDVHYFEGNHDLYLNRFWQEVLGVKVHSQAAYFQLADRTVRVEHGDQMDPEDQGYLFLRWFLRTPVMRFLALNMPDSWVLKIGSRASRTSRQYTSHVKTVDESQAKNKIRTHAQKAFLQQPFDLLVSGHVHIRDDHSFKIADKTARSINLGSWLSDPGFLRVTDGSVEWCSY